MAGKETAGGIRLRKEPVDETIVEMIDEQDAKMDKALSPAERKQQNPKKAILLGALVPGAGQFYNYQVTKSIFTFLLFFLSFGSSAFYFLALFLRAVVSRVLSLLLSITGRVLLLLTAPLDWCDTSETTTICGMVRALVVLGGQFWVKAELYWLRTTEKLLTFPPPPLTRHLYSLFDSALDNSLIAVAVMLLVFGGLYLLQLGDAYRNAERIAKGSLVIKRSRKRQLVHIVALNFLPYLLLLLPIPGANWVAEIMVSTLMEGVSHAVETMGNQKMKDEEKQIKLSKQSVWRQLRSIAVAKTLEFVQYSLIVLVVALYLVWWAILIGLWFGKVAVSIVGL